MTTRADSIRNMTDEEAIEAHITCGHGGNEEFDAEFWRRFPLSHGFHNAYAYARSEAYAEWARSHPDADPLDKDGGYEPPPIVTALRETYREHVDRLRDDPAYRAECRAGGARAAQEG